MDSLFSINVRSIIEPLQAGFFISPGQWQHSTRQIDSFELILVHDGTVNMFEEEQTFSAQPGEMLILFPGRTHGGTKVFYGKLSFYWLHFKLKELENTTVQHNIIKLYQHFVPIDSMRLNMLFRQYLNDKDSGILTQQTAELQILQILAEAARAENKCNASNIIAEQVFRYIAEHYNEPISTACIANEIRRNPDYIGRCFKDARGITITEEINRRRMMEAERLLNDSDLNLNEISAQCGFNDPGYFRRLFMRRNGTTPGKFRRRFSRIHINTQ